MGSVAIPERTVDIWVTAAIVQQFPDAILWAPTQRSSPDFDLAGGVGPEGKLFVLESKAPYVAENSKSGYTIQIDQRQAYNYLRHPQLRARTFYILPCPPFDPAIAAPSTAGKAPDERLPLIPPASHYRLGPPPAVDWFEVVSVEELWSELWGTTIAIGDPYWFPGKPVSTKSIDPCNIHATHMTLEEFLERLRDCLHLEDLYYKPPGEDHDDRIWFEGEPSPPWAPTTIAALIPRTPENFPDWI